MKQVLLKEVKQGDYFRLSENGKTYIRKGFVRSEGKYEVVKADDINDATLLKANRKVLVGFTY